MNEPNNETMIFRESGGKWLRVDSREQEPPTLANILEKLNVIIDDNAQFCRIIRYYDKWKQTIIYRAYTCAKITISIYYNKYD